MTCEELRAVAVDVALDDLTGAERAAALTHLAGCTECRALVTDLAAVADSLLLLAPSVEPPSGFESRVVGRLDVAPVRRRRPWTAVAVAAAALVGVVAGVALSRADGSSLPVAAELRTSSGASAGNVLLADDPDRMTCVFEDERFGGRYDVEVVLADGSVTDVGSFSADGSPWTWTVSLPVDAADVREVRVRDGDGVVRVTAEV